MQAFKYMPAIIHLRPGRRKRVGLYYTGLGGLILRSANDSSEKNLRPPQNANHLRKSG
jgi:hypothetical protein